MDKSGRFRSTTKTKIHTLQGTILKITKYKRGSKPRIEFQARPHCIICGKHTDCLCFTKDNSDTDPYESAINGLKRGWLCGSTECLIEYEKRDDFENYERLMKDYKGDRPLIAHAISLRLPEMEEGEFCEL